MAKPKRSQKFVYITLFAVPTLLLTPACMLSVSAAKPLHADLHFLHDGEKTTNPWSHDEKQRQEARETIASAKEYIRRKPSVPGNYINRSDAYLHLMQPKEAFADASTALALKPKDKNNIAAAYGNRGQALLQLKQYKPALDDLAKACALDVENGEAFYFSGMAKEMLGHLPEAIRDYETAHSLGFTPKGIKVDFSPYMTELNRRIKSNWHPHKSDTTKRAVVMFKIARNGSLSYLHIDRTSGVAETDAAAIAAVNQTAPFQPLPKGSPRDVDIQFTFDYNVVGTGPAGGATVVSFLEKVTEKWDKAESEAYKKVSEARKGKDENAIADAELKLAKIYTDRGKYPDAISLYQSALQVLEKTPEKQLIVGKTLGHLAVVYSLQGKTLEAETQFKKSLEIVDKDSGYPSDPEVAEILKEYAKVLYKAKKIDEANKIFARLKKQTGSN